MSYTEQDLQAIIDATKRRLATIRTISELKPIAKADKIELAIIDGWQVVVKKGDFKPNDFVLYLEIDSFVPHEVAPFLTKDGHEPKEYNGVKGQRLRTIKLRGEVSQGLVLPMSVLYTAMGQSAYLDLIGGVGSSLDDLNGTDVTEILKIEKYERPLAACLRGNASRYFPNFIQKTDQERIQNRLRTLEGRSPEEQWEVTLKMDGSSTTFYVHNNAKGDGVLGTGVCSRNLELKTDESNKGNAFVDKFYELEIDRKLREFHEKTGRNIAIQGELWGEGINGNWEGVQGINFHAFEVFDCDKYSKVPAFERYEILAELGIAHVPIIAHGTLADFDLGSLNIEHFLAFADKPSMHNKVAEGFVFKSLTYPDFSFKVINNKYLLEGGE